MPLHLLDALWDHVAVASITGRDHSNDHHRKVPTLQEIATKVTRLEIMQLDEKQYIAYEMIACTFLLGLVKDGHDSNTTLFTSLQEILEDNPSAEIVDIVKRLKARGGQEQLLIFLTQPAGSGTSTAMGVVEQFCYECCVDIGFMWCDRTFLFTAHRESAASLIGRVTISKAAYINQNKQLSTDNINEWKDVRILVINEVSFMSNSILRTLKYKLMNIGNRSKSFGVSIIFAGDFRQLKPICSKQSDLIFSCLSTNTWKNNINAIIILDNEYSFKEDPDYGHMLKRMWNGVLTTEDHKRINTRVIG
jgi:hypothetical protein